MIHIADKHALLFDWFWLVFKTVILLGILAVLTGDVVRWVYFSLNH